MIGQIQKTFRNVLSKQEGSEEANTPIHATVPLMPENFKFFFVSKTRSTSG
jgi:hypothetical protein